MKMALLLVLVKSLGGVIFLCMLAACGALSGQRTLYEQGGIRIGLESDPFITRTAPLGGNRHPVRFTSEQIRQLLSVLEVTGYSGTLAALFIEPSPNVVFSNEELNLIASPIAEAFQQATPSDRIFFSLPNLRARYQKERTEGALFFRDPNLFILLKDHSAFTRTDTGGGEDERDPRDHQAMHLSVASPVQAVKLAQEDSPRWGPYEDVHLAINVQQVFAVFAKTPSTRKAQQAATSTVPLLPKPQASESLHQQTNESVEDLRLQVRELTSANQDLRKLLSEQTAEMEALKSTLSKIQQEINQTKNKSGSRRKAPPQ